VNKTPLHAPARLAFSSRLAGTVSETSVIASTGANALSTLQELTIADSVSSLDVFGESKRASRFDEAMKYDV